MMDKEEEFMCRPALAAVTGISQGASYPGEDVFMDAGDGELVLAGAWALAGVLPRYDEGFEKPFHYSMSHNPQ